MMIKWISKFIYSKIIKFDSSINYFDIEHRNTIKTVFDGSVFVTQQNSYSCLYIGRIGNDVNIVSSWIFEKKLKENIIEIIGNTYKTHSTYNKSSNIYIPFFSAESIGAQLECYTIKPISKFNKFLNKLFLFRDDCFKYSFKYKISRKKYS